MNDDDSIIEAKRLAEDARQKNLQQLGLADQYNLWRESLPNERMSDGDVYDIFMEAQDVERAGEIGKLSASTGGEEITSGTDIPTPGPDAEGDSPDEAGDTSKGPEDDPTDLKLVEGMWQPPEEAQAENHEPPSTQQMSNSKEWLENARIVHEFMDGPKMNQAWVSASGNSGTWPSEPEREMNDMELATWSRNNLSSFNWNVLSTMDVAQQVMSADDPKLALAYLNLINMYDYSDGGGNEFAKALGGIATDPTTYLGFGAGSVVAKGVAKATAKTALKKAVQMSLVGATAGGMEGGMLAGGFDLTVQNIEQEAGARQDIDKSRAAMATTAGVGMGMTLGGAGGRWAGRKMDIIAEALEKDIKEMAARDAALEMRGGKQLNIDDLQQMLEVSAQASAKVAQDGGGPRDLTGTMSERILEAGDGSVPHKADGSADWGKVISIMDEVKAEEVAAQKAINKKKYDDLVDEGKLQPEEGKAANEDFVPDIADEESQKLAQMVLEMQELEKADIVLKTPGRPGSRVIDELGETLEVVGRTQNGWYRMRDSLGRERSLRRGKFEVVEKAPAPRKAGPMELDPFSKTGAKIIEMNERAVSGKLVAQPITHSEQADLVKAMNEVGIDITAKDMASHWTPAELMFLRDTYDAQARGMADISRELSSRLNNEGRLMDSDLAYFNNAHVQFTATRDLFFGVSGNAARQLNILRTKPTAGVYEFNQSLMDSITLQGGRANTERAIRLMADFAGPGKEGGVTKEISRISKGIWGNPTAAAMLNIRYNLMLSSWRTHFFNFFGNSASGVYQHLMVSPVRMGINNMAYARDLARSKIDPKYTPDPADRMTRHQYYAELRGHYAGFRDSLALAKEIAMGRDIGEGKVFNELGLRYNVINVPDSAFGKLGTTPVRMLEAGDAFFKNQYYNSKMHEFASIQARTEQVHRNGNYQKRYDYYMENPDALGPAAERQAKAFAQKQTYTNDPNVYGGVLSNLAKSVSTLQNKSLMVNMIVPFVRTPANLLSYSMEMIGGQLANPKTYDTIMHGTARESQEAIAKLTVAAGLWLGVAEMYENGDISGTGPTNWEEKKVWEAAGWQPNSIRIQGDWYDLSRAAPGGQSLATIASVFDYYAMTQQQDKPAMEWVGAGLLYTADMIVDESYLSTASDLITAVSSKETGRAQSATASMINSILVPNLMRDLRRPADATMRSGTSPNLMVQVVKQMKNASPWHSTELAPQRDWKGDIKNYWGNAYQRALIPFTIKGSEEHDPASMALAYSRIPVSTPSKTISWPGGMGEGIDLFAMDNGGGYVYDKYKEIMGKQRKLHVDTLMGLSLWRDIVERGAIGPGSEGDYALRRVLGMASETGRIEMLGFLIDHSGDNNTYTRPSNEDGKPFIYEIQHQVSVSEYKRLRNMIAREHSALYGGEGKIPDQYIMRKPIDGPEFFKPQ